MQHDSMEYSLPAHWLPALINDDRTGLSDEDEEQLTAFTRSEVGGMRQQGWRFGHWAYGEDEPFFDPFHDARFTGCLPCDCQPVTAHFLKA
jgi:hypothetical protein